jgi:hypothetical protein
MIKEVVKSPESAKDKRVAKELAEANKEDFVYSPKSTDTQQKNGKRTEDHIKELLDFKKIEYITEKESREKELHTRTPDFLFKKPHDILGRKIHWFESKASFGDVREMRKDYKKQLEPYTQQFGRGAVIYWYGYVIDHGFEDLLVLTRDDIIHKKV